MLRSRLWPLAGFAVAFAYLEAAVVVYLRRVLGVTDLIRDVPPLDPFIAAVEIGREAATLLMLLALGWAAGRTPQTRIGFAFFAFGAWDIFYYVWLKLLIGWPGSLLDPDILFLIPLPWWGPVLAPVLVAALVAIGGARAVMAEDGGREVRPRPVEWCALALGTGLVLYSFMADALYILPATAEQLNQLRPGPFRWGAFLTGLAGMGWSIGRATRGRLR